jgi:sugar lactone lactonase YvrE
LQRLLPIPTGSYRAQPTGMDFARDGSAAAVLTYGNVCIFPRNPAETWTEALSRKPQVLPPHGLTQAEGVAFAPDSRTIYVTSEGTGTAILRYRPEK